jgi:hypothetical protein
MAKFSWVSRAAMVAVVAFPGAALAADAGNVVQDRYEGTGIRAGSFWYLSNFEFGGFYDSNIFAEPEDPEDAFGAYFQSTLTAKSDWGRHGIEVSLFGDRYQYFDEEELTRNDAALEIKGYVDITSDLVLNGGVRLDYGQLAPGDIDAPLTAEEPTPRAEARTWAEITKQFNRLYVSVGADFEGQQYDNVESRFETLIDTDGLDGYAWSAGGRAGYEISPGYRVFGDARYNQMRWEPAFENTDSEGVEALFGAAFELTRLITGEISVGYFRQDFEDGEFEDPEGFDYHAALFWNPTPLMTVTLAADRSIEPTSIPDLAGAVRDAVALSIDYEVMRSLLITPKFRLYNNEYIEEDDDSEEEIDVEDFGWEAGVTADYKMNRFWSVGAHYTFTDRDAEVNELDLSYERHFVGIYAKARL